MIVVMNVIGSDDVARTAACPGCGAWFPDAAGPTHPYMTGSPGCWQRYGQLLAVQYLNPSPSTIEAASACSDNFLPCARKAIYDPQRDQEDVMCRIDESRVVEGEYRTEETHARRASVFANYLRGGNAKDVALAVVASAMPSRVLDVGCGEGDFAERVRDATGADVTAVDTSARMVGLARGRGLTATVADIEGLAFEDRSFDCVTATWMLYHVADLAQGVRELARVVSEDGLAVVTTMAATNLSELWDLVGPEGNRNYSFTRENGSEILGASFGRVELQEVDAQVVFPDRQAVVDYVGATIGHPELAQGVPDLDGEFSATARQAIFIARHAER